MKHISDKLPILDKITDMPILPTLLFDKPVFHSGINVTCRNGYKWAQEMGSIVNVRDTDGTTDYGLAHILGIMTVKLNKIPECVLTLEHDSNCQTLDGIITEMKNIYGQDLKEDAPTTVVFFEMEKVS